MRCPADSPENKKNDLRESLIGLGERSHRKSYYPELQRRLDELERFKALLDHNNDAIFLLDVPDGNIIDLNETSCRQLGWDSEDLLGRSIFDLSALGSDSRAHDLIGNASASPQSQAMVESTLYRRDGESFPAEITLARRSFQERAYVIAVARDITKRRQTEQALKATLAEEQKSKNKIDTILKSIADGLIVTDTDKKIVLMNRSAQSLLDTPLDKAIGRPLEDLLARKMVHTQAHCAWPLGTSGDPTEWEIPTREGKWPQVIQTHFAPVQDREGEVSGEVAILRDITRERELVRMKDAFISRAAHELRTPLTSILGFTEVLITQEKYGLKDPKLMQEGLQNILKNGERLSTIVQDLMDLCIVQAGKSIVLDAAPCNLEILFAERAELYQDISDRHRIELILPDDLPRPIADERRIKQVLDNLLSNAIKYSPKGGTIRLCAERSAQEIEISVEDSGIGMDPQQIERIFDRFYRIDTTDTAVEGLGLGMGMARTIIEAHGGRIWVESEPGKGTKVSFSLPGKRA
ncbi:PAS domain-containing sensor histidine kinase [Trichloromonas sp.]|uniref:sensor histidine kinase n=1 Tax=Trichloromonas sp. TaxID=3069249 RepID=UPI003D81A36D